MDSNKIRPLKFMLVEDSEGDAYLFRRALAEAKLLNDVAVFEDGQSANEALEAFSNDDLPGMIFLDINMPGMTGFEVLKRS